MSAFASVTVHADLDDWDRAHGIIGWIHPTDNRDDDLPVFKSETVGELEAGTWYVLSTEQLYIGPDPAGFQVYIVVEVTISDDRQIRIGRAEIARIVAAVPGPQATI